MAKFNMKFISIIILYAISFSSFAGFIIKNDIIVSDDESFKIVISERHGDNESPLKIEIIDKRENKIIGIHDNICDLGRPSLCSQTKAYWNSEKNILILSYLFPKIPSTHFYSIINKKSHMIDKSVVFKIIKEHISLKEYNYGSHIEFIEWITPTKCKIIIKSAKFGGFVIFDAIVEFKTKEDITKMVVLSLKRRKQSP